MSACIYKAELDSLYHELERIKDALNDAYAEKNAAYGRVKRAKSDIESWYSRSRGTFFFWCNGGRKLPRHALFGQSFGDLKGYKEDRGNAVCDIRYWSNRISSLKASRAEVGKKIGHVKAARQMMFDRKREEYLLRKQKNRPSAGCRP